MEKMNEKTPEQANKKVIDELNAFLVQCSASSLGLASYGTIRIVVDVNAGSFDEHRYHFEHKRRVNG